MSILFEELYKLPCYYCKYRNNYNSKCLKRSTSNPENGIYEKCEMMELDYDILVDGIENYFEFVKNT